MGRLRTNSHFDMTQMKEIFGFHLKKRSRVQTETWFFVKLDLTLA
jgi:hypothetical protein